MKKILHIEGMTCGHCKMKVEKALGSLAPVKDVDVDLIEGIAEVELSNDLDDTFFVKQIEEAGYKLRSIKKV